MRTAFSTVLFVDGNPVGYKVRNEDNNHFIMNPAENPGREVLPPILHVSQIAGHWQVQGTSNTDLIDQAIEEVRQNLLLPPHYYSAAP